MNRIDVVFKRPDNVQTELVYGHVGQNTFLGDAASVWNEVFSGNFENAALRKEETEIQFIPNLSLKPKYDNSSSKYSLSVFGVSISDIDVMNGVGRIIFDVIPRVNTMNQMDPLILAVKNLPEETKNGLKIDLVCEDISLGTTQYFSLPYLTWKKDLLALFLDYSIAFVDISSELNADGSRKETLINLVARSDPDVFTSVENQVFLTNTFMRFSLRQIQITPEPVDDPRILPIIKSSFKHELTSIGLRTLERFEFELLDRFRQWYGVTLLISL